MMTIPSTLCLFTPDKKTTITMDGGFHFNPYLNKIIPSIPLMKMYSGSDLDWFGGINWARTSDPHDVNVVL